MNKAFTKEDDNAPEAVAQGPVFALPPGVKNYLTPEGARRLRDELERLQQVRPPTPATSQRISYLQQSLGAAEIVPPPDAPLTQVRFGATVTVRNDRGVEVRYRIVGIDESDRERGWVSWRSPIATALLKARVGQKVHCKLPDGEEVLQVVAIG